MGFPYPTLMVAPIIGLAVNAAFQVLTLRVFRQTFNFSIIAGMLSGIGITCGITLAALNVPSEDGLPLFLMNTATALALSFCYWNFLNLNMTSLRIRMLKELWRAPSGSMSPAELLAIYHPREMLDRRLKRLAAKKQIRLESGRYYAQGTWAAAMVHIIALLRWIILPSRKDLNQSR